MKKSFILALVSFTSFFFLTSVASAQLETSAAGAAQGISTFADLITRFTTQVISALGTFFLSAGVVAFFYGVVQYIWGLRQGDAGKAKIGNEFMIWGLVGLFVMFSVYGIIKIAQSLIPGLNATVIDIPRVNFGGSGSAANPTPARPGTPGAYSCYPSADCVQNGVAGKCNTAGTACLPNYQSPSASETGTYSCSPGICFKNGVRGVCNSTGNDCLLN